MFLNPQNLSPPIYLKTYMFRFEPPKRQYTRPNDSRLTTNHQPPIASSYPDKHTNHHLIILSFPSLNLSSNYRDNAMTRPSGIKNNTALPLSMYGTWRAEIYNAIRLQLLLRATITTERLWETRNYLLQRNIPCHSWYSIKPRTIQSKIKFQATGQKWKNDVPGKQ